MCLLYGLKLNPSVTFFLYGLKLNPSVPLSGPLIRPYPSPYHYHRPLINYLMFEAIDAMDQERATGGDCPLNLHWQQFVHLLRIKKPKLGAYLDRLRDQLQETQGGVQ